MRTLQPAGEPTFVHSAIAALALVAVGACANVDVGEATENTDEVEAQTDALLGESRNFAFPPRDEALTEVKVCWDTLEGNADQRAWIQEGAELWSAATNNWLYFTGWNKTCAQNPGATRLYFGGSGNCEATSSGVRFLPNAGQTYSKYCGGHELGHIIGFQHEHRRYDFETCNNGTVPSAGGGRGDMFLGPVDNSSIMSYCSGTPTSLSAGDIDAARKIFGGGYDVKHDKNYALRLQTDRYLLIRQSGTDVTSSNRAINTTTGWRHIFRVKKQSGTGAVKYGDQISLSTAPFSAYESNLGPVNISSTARYLCASGGTLSVGSSACYWTVERTAGGKGSSTLDVNNPFRLKIGNTWLEHGGEKDLRFTGDFAGNELYDYVTTPANRFFQHNGLAYKPDADTARFLCKELGYIGGIQTGTYNGSDMPATARVWTWDSGTQYWWGPGEWNTTSSTGGILGRIQCQR